MKLKSDSMTKIERPIYDAHFVESQKPYSKVRVHITVDTLPSQSTNEAYKKLNNYYAALTFLWASAGMFYFFGIFSLIAPVIDSGDGQIPIELPVSFIGLAALFNWAAVKYQRKNKKHKEK